MIMMRRKANIGSDVMSCIDNQLVHRRPTPHQESGLVARQAVQSCSLSLLKIHYAHMLEHDKASADLIKTVKACFSPIAYRNCWSKQTLDNDIDQIAMTRNCGSLSEHCKAGDPPNGGIRNP